ncbi:MAG: nitrilase-related carbon-nitrogen hydrolase, partial [Pirellulales bacterium]|nr:nitrilase-related carbon-nitrogen hydrolase [Pirellulales bacterium]
MQLVHVATAAVNQTPLAWDENRANILEAIAQAKDRNVSILCLPELCITGYGCEDAFHASGVLRTAAEVLEEIVPHTKDIVVSVA